MDIREFYAETGGRILVAREQASRFAVYVAGDLNPIHDADNRRFCVPGDLLFAIVLAKCGLFPRMEFTFSGMVGRGVELVFPAALDGGGDITDAEGKTYLSVSCEGTPDRDPAHIEALTCSYVAFSGHNFPHILVPLMKKHGVMINPTRPLAIYESMSFELTNGASATPALELSETRLDIDGRRGDAYIHFRICDGDRVVGTGCKKLVLSGLRPYTEEGIKALIGYHDSRAVKFGLA